MTYISTWFCVKTYYYHIPGNKPPLTSYFRVPSGYHPRTRLLTHDLCLYIVYIISSYIQSYIIWCIILYILSKYQIFYIYIRYIQCLVSRQFPQHPQERNASEPRPSKGSAYPAPASSSSNEGAAQRWATVFSVVFRCGVYWVENWEVTW